MFAEKLIHIDLKGFPPKPDFLKALFPFFKEWGATGLCIEWEDMLPFEDGLEIVRSPNAYSKAEVAGILSAARDAGLSVIPLVQTFGHLEFVLKHRPFSRLREKPEFQMDLCPSHPDALPLVKTLIDQVLSFHPDVEAVHLGGDEVWSLGSCPKCADTVKRNGKATLYLEHMLPVLEFVRSKGLRPLIWDDMMRDWNAEALERMAGLAEPVVWRYNEDIEHNLPEGMWERFEKAFPESLWAASAFKGAGGVDIIWPPMEKYVRNHLAWLERARRTPFKGIILTGWSRYNHNTTTCETLPAALPSLALCLATLREGRFDEELRREVTEDLGLGDMPLLHRSTDKITTIPNGNFPGGEVFSLMGKIQGARALVEAVRRDSRVYFPRFNGGRRDPFRWSEIAGKAHRALEILADARPLIERVLPPLFFEADVAEFIHSKVNPLEKEAADIAREAEALLAE